jgi:hypothetical protein
VPGDPDARATAEETANLPLEIQGAFDAFSRASGKAKRDDDAVFLVLRRGPSNRIEPYADFITPRRRAAARTRINGDRPIARFTRAGDPRSLRFARGFEPDFDAGIAERTDSASRLFGGRIRKFRIVSHNRLVQYQFVAAPRHVWLNPPQTLTTEISSYGVRTLDAVMDEDAFIPGFEYHYLDETVEPPEWHSQIPAGYAGRPSRVDPSRADAMAWIRELPVVREFAARVLQREI